MDGRRGDGRCNIAMGEIRFVGSEGLCKVAKLPDLLIPKRGVVQFEQVGA
jgi:hypothetical protein